jgi:hypothetical protein
MFYKGIGVIHWYVAKYFSSDLSIYCDLQDLLIRINNTDNYIAFYNDLKVSLSSIRKNLMSSNLLASFDPKIQISHSDLFSSPSYKMYIENEVQFRGQGPAHWYIAKYFNADLSYLIPFEILLGRLIKAFGWYGFCADLAESSERIRSDLAIIHIYTSEDNKVLIKKIYLESFSDFKTYWYARYYKVIEPNLLSNDIAPVFNNQISPLVTMITDGQPAFMTEDLKINTYEEVKDQVVALCTQEGKDLVVKDDPQILLAMDYTGNSYDDIIVLGPENVIIEDKVAMPLLESSLRLWTKKFEDDTFFSDIITPNINYSDPNIVIPYSDISENTLSILSLSLESLVEYSLDLRHITNSQDVPIFLAKRCGILDEYIKSQDLFFDFQVGYNNSFSDVDSFLFSETWIRGKSFEEFKLNSFVPVFVGLENTPFVMIRCNIDTGWEGRISLKFCCSISKKMYKISGLWLRSNQKFKKLRDLIQWEIGNYPFGYLALTLEKSFWCWDFQMEFSQYTRAIVFRDKFDLLKYHAKYGLINNN